MELTLECLLAPHSLYCKGEGCMAEGPRVDHQAKISKCFQLDILNLKEFCMWHLLPLRIWVGKANPKGADMSFLLGMVPTIQTVAKVGEW